MTPTTKVVAGGLAGSVTILIVWIVHTWLKVDVPPEIASALTTIAYFVTSYLTPNQSDGG